MLMWEQISQTETREVGEPGLHIAKRLDYVL